MVTVFILYVVVHLLAYVLVLRHLELFRTEKGIFLYHCCSAVLTGLAGVFCAVLDPRGFGIAGLVLVVSVQGLYSVSFLELWSLAQGGYSLSIIHHVVRARASNCEPDLTALARIGETKQGNRIAGLQRFGLVVQSVEQVSLSERGSRVAAMLAAILRWIDPNANA